MAKKLLLTPSEQETLSKKFDKITDIVGEIKYYQSISSLFSMLSDIQRAIAEADIDAKSTDSLSFKITAHRYHADWDKAKYCSLAKQSNLRLPTLTEMREILECYDNPISEGEYWVANSVSSSEAFLYNVNKKGIGNIISDAKNMRHSYFYVQDKSKGE